MMTRVDPVVLRRLLCEAIVEIERLKKRELQATAVICAFAGPDGFRGWHDKYRDAIRAARAFLGDISE